MIGKININEKTKKKKIEVQHENGKRQRINADITSEKEGENKITLKTNTPFLLFYASGASL